MNMVKKEQAQRDHLRLQILELTRDCSIDTLSLMVEDLYEMNPDNLQSDVLQDIQNRKEGNYTSLDNI